MSAYDIYYQPIIVPTAELNAQSHKSEGGSKNLACELSIIEHSKVRERR